MGNSLHDDFVDYTMPLNDGHPITPSELCGAMQSALREHQNCSLLREVMHQDPGNLDSFLESRIEAAKAGHPINGDSRDLPELFGTEAYSAMRGRIHVMTHFLAESAQFWKLEVEGDVDESHHYDWHYY